MLAHVLCEHWPAVRRDLLGMGFRVTRKHLFNTLSVGEMMAVIVAAPPGSAVYHALHDGWTITDHLLASQIEQNSGLITFPERLKRPGVTDTRPPKFPDIRDKKLRKIECDSMTIQEYEAKRKARAKKKKAG